MAMKGIEHPASRLFVVVTAATASLLTAGTLIAFAVIYGGNVKLDPRAERWAEIGFLAALVMWGFNRIVARLDRLEGMVNELKKGKRD